MTQRTCFSDFFVDTSQWERKVWFYELEKFVLSNTCFSELADTEDDTR